MNLSNNLVTDARLALIFKILSCFTLPCAESASQEFWSLDLNLMYLSFVNTSLAYIGK